MSVHVDVPCFMAGRVGHARPRCRIPKVQGDKVKSPSHPSFAVSLPRGSPCYMFLGYPSRASVPLQINKHMLPPIFCYITVTFCYRYTLFYTLLFSPLTCWRSNMSVHMARLCSLTAVWCPPVPPSHDSQNVISGPAASVITWDLVRNADLFTSPPGVSDASPSVRAPDLESSTGQLGVSIFCYRKPC